MQEFLLLSILILLVIVIIKLFLPSSQAKTFDNFEFFLNDLRNNLTNLNNNIKDSFAKEFSNSRQENNQAFAQTREEITNQLEKLGEILRKSILDIADIQKNQLDSFAKSLNELSINLDTKNKNLTEQLLNSLKDSRAELSNNLKQFSDVLDKNIKDFNELLHQNIKNLIENQEKIRIETEGKLKEIRETVDNKLNDIQEDNSKKLEEMRKTVDEKLQETVEKRFNDSFKLISDRLEQVHKGLGEMQSIATSVGDLKKVLSNVKTRGNLGEIQLGAILEEILTPEQYDKNVAVKPRSDQRVEYAVKIPSKTESDKYIYLPIDSKFPIEDYQRLLDAYDNVGDMSPKDFEAISKNFENSIKKNAKDIKEKYIEPPNTTDFAIMFVPTEGLYAEILRRNGLFETLQKEFKVTVVGPANLAAFLNSLQMGFRTLAIEKRSSEVWEILGAIKTEFGKFGDLLEKTKKKLQEATNVIDDAGKKTRTIQRKLKDVQSLPSEKSQLLLNLGDDLLDEENEN
ncbi:MAG TPA: DNA recombination protein RmuC [Ignavibacteriales bacterium]|nr:DNA recombination protein RmuC [Ignavibacteriales bacterium]